MPHRVKSFFEIYKTNIDLFLVIMNVLIYQGSESEDRGLLCGYSVKSQFESCGAYSKKQYAREVVGLR